MRDIFIRCDIGGHDGYGHATRMHAVAMELVSMGHKPPTFVSATPAIRNIVHPCPVKDMTMSDDGFLRAMQGVYPDNLLIIDKNYYWRDEDLWRLNQRTPVIRIDHPTAEAGTCRALVLPNNHMNPKVIANMSAAHGAALYYGFEYVIVSPAVQQMRVVPPVDRKPQVAIAAGGSDPHGALNHLYEVLRPIRSISKMFLVGSASKFTIPRPLDANSIIAPFDMRYIAESQCLVTMHGQTTYEALFLRVPVIGIGHSDDNCSAAWRLGALMQNTGFMYAGDIRKLNPEPILADIELVTQNGDFRSRSFDNTDRIDGLGAARIAEIVQHIAGEE